jgi:hypothetical protein
MTTRRRVPEAKGAAFGAGREVLAAVLGFALFCAGFLTAFFAGFGAVFLETFVADFGVVLFGVF